MQRWPAVFLSAALLMTGCGVAGNTRAPAAPVAECSTLPLPVPPVGVAPPNPPLGPPQPLTGEWRPVHGIETVAPVTSPVTIYAGAGDFSAPNLPGTAVPLWVRVWNPGTDVAVKVEDLQLEFAVGHNAADGSYTELWTGLLPRLNATLPPRGGYDITVNWVPGDAAGAALPPGHSYMVTLHPATVHYRAGNAAALWPFSPWTRTTGGFTITYPKGTTPHGVRYDGWQVATPAGNVRLTINSLKMGPTRTELEGSWAAEAYAGVALGAPEAWALTPTGPERLEGLGSSGGGVLSPSLQFPVRGSLQASYGPLPPGATALCTRWLNAKGDRQVLVLAIPLTDTGEPVTAADLAAVNRLAGAIDAAFAPDKSRWDRGVLQRARSSHWQATQFLHSPGITWTSGAVPSDAARREIFRRLAVSVFALESVREFTLVTPGGQMRLTRDRYSSLKLDNLNGAQLDTETCYGCDPEVMDLPL